MEKEKKTFLISPSSSSQFLSSPHKKLTDRKLDRKTDRETDRKTDRKTNRQRDFRKTD